MVLHNTQGGSACFLLSSFFFISSKEGDREMEVTMKMERLGGMEKEKYQ